MHPYRTLTIERSIASNHTITDKDVETSQTLRAVAVDYIDTYSGDVNFIYKLKAVPTARLSIGQMRAALKIMIDEAKAAAPKAPPKPMLHKGRYTIVNNGHEFTVKITEYKGTNYKVPQGTQSVRLMVGHANNFAPVAFIYPNRALRMSSEYVNNFPLVDAINALLIDDDPVRFAEAYALANGKCWHCHRDISKAESIVRGVGPDCAKKLGIANPDMSNIDVINASPAIVKKATKQRANPNCDTCLGEGEHPDDDLADELGISGTLYMPCFTCRRKDYDAKETGLRSKYAKV